MMRIRPDHVAQHLADAGYLPSQWEQGDWTPGYRTASDGLRRVHVFHDGPGEADELARYTLALRELGYCVRPSQQSGGGRRRLEVTKP